METLFSPYTTLSKIAATGLRNQIINPGDTYDEQGLLVCGCCHKHKQIFVMIADPLPDDPDHERPLKVTAQCDCEKQAEEEAKKAAEAKERMAKLQQLRKLSLMDEKYRDVTFDKLTTNQYNEKNLKKCRRYADLFDKMMENNQGLLLWGDVGTGKSWAAASIANELMNRGIPVIMTSFVSIISDLMEHKTEESALIARLNAADLVIFDDLGAERDSNYALERVYNIVDSRTRKEKPMIFTTNLLISDMKSEEDRRYRRIYDRIFETCYPMQFTGPSWRRKSASRRFYEMEELLSGDD